MREELLNLNGILHVRISFLEKYGLSAASIHNRLSANRKGMTKGYQHFSDPNDHRVKWIILNSVPPGTRKTYQIPPEEKLLLELDENHKREALEPIRQSLFHAYHQGFTPFLKYYHGIYFDQDAIELHARTHAVFHACADLKRFGRQVREIYSVFSELSCLSFPGKSLKSFYHKLADFECKGAEALTHGSQGKLKSNKKLKPDHINQIEKLFRNPKLLSGPEITEDLNNWASRNGFRKLSISAVRRVITEPHFQNRNRPYRNGREWVDRNFLPYRLRLDPE